MQTVKRWAFVPLLLLVGAVIGGAIANSGRDSRTLGNLLGVVVALLVAVAIDWRRRRRGYWR